MIYANQLNRALTTIQPCYCLVGSDPFLVQESALLIRQAASKQGYDQRQVFTLENPSHFDWEGFHQALFSNSLFADKTIVEWIWQASKLTESTFERCMPFNPGPDVCVIIRAGGLSKAQINAKWFQAFMSGATIVQHWPPQGQELITWTQQRAQQHGLKLAPDAAKRLATHYEGRLYGIDQLLMKLELWPQAGQIDLDTVNQHIDAQASFDVFALQSALLAQDPAQVLLVLNHFKRMKIEISLILWCLQRLLHTLYQAKSAPAKADAQWLKGQGIWPKEHSYFHRWLANLTSERVQTMMRALSEIDKLHKTGESTESWQQLCNLCLKSISALPHVY